MMTKLNIGAILNHLRSSYMFEKEAKNRIESYEEQEPIIPKLTTEEKCRFCINCDVDGKTCIAKIEAPFGSFVCENNEKFEPYEE